MTTTREERQQYLELARAKLQEWRAKIDQLKVRTNVAALQAEDTLRSNIERLEERYDAIRAHVDKAARAGGDAWKQARDSVESAWSTLEDEFGKAGGAPR